MAAMAYNWPNEQVDVIVVTDGRLSKYFVTVDNVSVFSSCSQSRAWTWRSWG
jgi:hypothetical protein